jgi:hypothetical protein
VWKVSGGIDYSFPSSLDYSILHPNAFLLLVNFDPAADKPALDAFIAKYHPASTAKILGPFQGRLSNSGELIRLEQPVDQFRRMAIVETVDYLPNSPWPDSALTGESLQRVKFREFANDPVNWKSAPPTPGWIDGELQQPLSLSAPTIDEGIMYFGVTADAGVALILESSAELDQWQTVSTTNSPTPNFSWTIPLPANQSNQFYRLRLGP